MICLAIVFIIAEQIIRSPFGRVLKGVREDETAAQALGKNTYRFKMIIFVVGCGMAGLAGSLYAHYISYIDPGSFVMWLTFFIILIIMLGGIGNNVGALVATAVFVLLREGLRFVKLPEGLNPAALQQLIFGLLLIVVTLYMPRGLIPERKITYRRNHDRCSRVEGLTKNFGELCAVDRCSFEVAQGTIQGLDRAERLR